MAWWGRTTTVPRLHCRCRDRHGKRRTSRWKPEHRDHQKRLHDVIHAIRLSKKTLGKVKQNLFFALFYNVIGIPIAARVFIGLGIVLRPELAGLAMVFSSISVVVNSLLLKGFHPEKKNYLSDYAPVVLTAVFVLMFIGFAKLSS